MTRPLSTENQSSAMLHIAVLLFGFTAILGDVISFAALPLVWWRVGLTAVALYLFFGVRKKLHSLDRELLLNFLLISTLVAAHWYTFFASIKASNASVALVCLSTTSFMTALLEPLILKKKISRQEVFLGLLIVPGMILIVRNLEFAMLQGVALGLISAFFGSFFSILNKKSVGRTDDFVMTFVQMGFAFVLISAVLGVQSLLGIAIELKPSALDLFYLLILAVLCTCVAYTLCLKSLKELSAFTSNLTINLEPIYGILLAALLLGDSSELTTMFYLGAALILLSVFCRPLWKLWSRSRKKTIHG